MKPQLLQPGDDGERLLLIPVGDGHQNIPEKRYSAPCRQQTLIEGAGHRVIDTHHLPCRLHLRAQIDIHLCQLAEGKDRRLDGHQGPGSDQAASVTHLPQGLSQHHLCAQFHHRNPGDLAQEGDRPARPGIDLQDIDIPPVINELNIEQPFNLQRAGQASGVVDHFFPHLILDPCRVNSDAVSGMDPCPFDMLHDAGDDHIIAVADGIDL